MLSCTPEAQAGPAAADEGVEEDEESEEEYEDSAPSGRPVLYISGEESKEQASTGRCLAGLPAFCFLLAAALYALFSSSC